MSAPGLKREGQGRSLAVLMWRDFLSEGLNFGWQCKANAKNMVIVHWSAGIHWTPSHMHMDRYVHIIMHMCIRGERKQLLFMKLISCSLSLCWPSKICKTDIKLDWKARTQLQQGGLTSLVTVRSVGSSWLWTSRLPLSCVIRRFPGLGRWDSHHFSCHGSFSVA